MEAAKDEHQQTSQEIYLKVVRTVTLGVNNTGAIDNVLTRFCDIEQVAANLEKTLFCGNHIKNGQILLDYDKDTDSALHIILDSGAAIKVRIKAPWSGKTIALDVFSWDTIQNIKSKFQDREGTPTKNVALIYNGKQLEDSQTLAAHNIANDSTLYAVYCGGDKIEISVRMPTGESIKIEVKLWYNVENVKTVIESMVGVSVNQQNLFFAGEHLESSRTLASYSIQTESLLHLIINMQIFVRSLDGKTVTLVVKTSDTIEDVKKKIAVKLDIPWDKQMLILGKKQLKNNCKLADYNVQRDATLKLYFQRF